MVIIMYEMTVKEDSLEEKVREEEGPWFRDKVTQFLVDHTDKNQPYSVEATVLPGKTEFVFAHGNTDEGYLKVTVESEIGFDRGYEILESLSRYYGGIMIRQRDSRRNL